MLEGFPPISRPDARTLILGSMPSMSSLRMGRYYAHPRNCFWPIISDLLGLVNPPYDDQINAAKEAGLAIWDVLRACERPGSLDSAIESTTMVPNDFVAFFSAHGHIDRIFFNGAKAESVYLKAVRPLLPSATRRLACHRLPSTSPAHASMNYEQKRCAWAAVVDLR